MKKLMSQLFIALILGIGTSISCFGHGLEALIEKADFVAFKKAYNDSELSETEKEGLWNQVNGIIDDCLKKIKPYWGVKCLH